MSFFKFVINKVFSRSIPITKKSVVDLTQKSVLSPSMKQSGVQQSIFSDFIKQSGYTEISLKDMNKLNSLM